MRRRNFIQSVLGASASLAAGLKSSPLLMADAPAAANLPAPEQSGIDHIVVVTMENRSFDHLLGWLPGANGKQSGLVFSNCDNQPVSTFPLAPDFSGCQYNDPDHLYDQARSVYNGGAMDGWLKTPHADRFSLGYYTEGDVPFLAALARNFTVLDRYHSSVLASTFPNRLFLHAAQTDRLGDNIDIATMPTIWDRLAAAQVPASYYYSNIPALALWGMRYASISRPYEDFLEAAASASLPAVSFIDPSFTVRDDGSGNDDRPHADIRNGDAFLARTFNAIASSPLWNSTVLIVTFNEWGGFFDHVPPPRAAASSAVDRDRIDDKTLLGFRVPAVIASPLTMNNSQIGTSVDSTLFDHTSILKLIQWRWRLKPLTARDASNEVGNLATALDFNAPRTDAPALPQAKPLAALACPGADLNATQDITSRSSPWLALWQSNPVDIWRNKSPHSLLK